MRLTRPKHDRNTSHSVQKRQKGGFLPNLGFDQVVFQH